MGDRNYCVCCGKEMPEGGIACSECLAGRSTHEDYEQLMAIREYNEREKEKFQLGMYITELIRTKYNRVLGFLFGRKRG